MREHVEYEIRESGCHSDVDTVLRELSTKELIEVAGGPQIINDTIIPSFSPNAAAG